MLFLRPARDGGNMGLGDLIRKAFSGSSKAAPQKVSQAQTGRAHKLATRKQMTRAQRGGKAVSKVLLSSRSKNSSLKFRVS